MVPIVVESMLVAIHALLGFICLAIVGSDCPESVRSTREVNNKMSKLNEFPLSIKQQSNGKRRGILLSKDNWQCNIDNIIRVTLPQKPQISF